MVRQIRSAQAVPGTVLQRADLLGRVTQQIARGLARVDVEAGDAIGMVVVEHQPAALLVGIVERHRIAGTEACMSGTFCVLTPFLSVAVSPAGVIHWWGVPSLIHGVKPPWRWSVARFCG